MWNDWAKVPQVPGQGLSLSCHLNFSGKGNNSVCYSRSRWYHVFFVGTSFHHTHTCTHSYLQGGELSVETRHFLSPTCGLWIIQALHFLLSLLGPVLLLYQDQLRNTQVLVTQSPLALCGSMDYRPLGFGPSIFWAVPFMVLFAYASPFWIVFGFFFFFWSYYFYHFYREEACDQY